MALLNVEKSYSIGNYKEHFIQTILHNITKREATNYVYIMLVMLYVPLQIVN